MPEKVCPLRAVAAQKDVPCLGEKCAWWFMPYNYRDKRPEDGRCALLELARTSWANTDK